MINLKKENAKRHLYEMATELGYRIKGQIELESIFEPKPEPKKSKGPVDWKVVFEDLSRSMTRYQFLAWIQPLQVKMISEGSLELLATNEFSSRCVKEKHKDEILKAVKRHFIVDEDFRVEVTT